MDSSFIDGVERHTQAFQRHLESMISHRKRVRGGDSFIVFEDEEPDATPKDALTRSRALALAQNAPDQSSGKGSMDCSESSDSVDGQSGGPGHQRYVQLCFQTGIFLIDLPWPVITPSEAQQVIGQRSGFHWLRHRRPRCYRLEEWKEASRDWNPLRKEYLNSDSRAAAEDISFLWFRLWHYPPDWQFWYEAHPFHDKRKHAWEGSYPVTLGRL